jgi:hypothetical protein
LEKVSIFCMARVRTTIAALATDCRICSTLAGAEASGCCADIVLAFSGCVVVE